MGQLTTLLAEAVNFCRESPGQIRRVDLGHGLQIRLYAEGEGVARVVIWHVLILRPEPTWPAAKEVETIMNHWPVPGQPKFAELKIVTLPASEVIPLNGLAWTWPERVIHGEAATP